MGPDRGHGHGIYAQNRTGIKTIEDVISFNNFNTGMKAYSESSYAVGVRFDGVISFNNGSPTYGGRTGARAEPLRRHDQPSGRRHHGDALRALPRRSDGGEPWRQPRARLLRPESCADGDGQLRRRRPLALKLARWSNVVMHGNFVNGSLDGLTPASYPANTFQTARPTGDAGLRQAESLRGRASQHRHLQLGIGERGGGGRQQRWARPWRRRSKFAMRRTSTDRRSSRRSTPATPSTCQCRYKRLPGRSATPSFRPIPRRSLPRSY